jgi:hypothetical protein
MTRFSSFSVSVGTGVLGEVLRGDKYRHYDLTQFYITLGHYDYRNERHVNDSVVGFQEHSVIIAVATISNVGILMGWDSSGVTRGICSSMADKPYITLVGKTRQRLKQT